MNTIPLSKEETLLTLELLVHAKNTLELSPLHSKEHDEATKYMNAFRHYHAFLEGEREEDE